MAQSRSAESTAIGRIPDWCIGDRQQAETLLDHLASRTVNEQQHDARQRVDDILDDEAARRCSRPRVHTTTFDGFDPDQRIAADADALEQAWNGLSNNLRDALELAHRRITDFHQRQRPADLAVTGPHGEQLGRRWRPVRRAGLYVPGGRAAYPSTVLMNAVPARVAGVDDIVIASPAGADGTVNPVVLAAAHLAGIRQVLESVAPRRSRPWPTAPPVLPRWM